MEPTIFTGRPRADEERQERRVIDFSGERRGQHHVGAAKCDHPDLQAFFFEQAFLSTDDKGESRPTSLPGPAVVEIFRARVRSDNEKEHYSCRRLDGANSNCHRLPLFIRAHGYV